MAKSSGRTDTESVMKLVIDGKQSQTSLKQLTDTAARYRAELSKLVREDNPQLYDEKVKNIQKLNEAWRKSSKEIRGVATETKSFRSELAGMAKQAIAGMGIAGTFYALKQGLEIAITKNAELSDTIAGVQKTTGLTEDAVDRLNAKFKQMDTRTANTELLGLAQVAGKLGYTAEKDVEGFVRAADKIGVALGEDLGGVEESVNALGKLVDIFKIKDQFGLEDALMKVGSAINSLGASGSAAEKNLIDFTQRLAGIAPAAGMSLADTLGLAATLDELGQSMEAGATATGQFIMGLGKDIPKNAKIAKMSTEEFTKLLKEDANEALIRVLEGARTAGGGLEALANNMGVLQVSGARGVAALGALAENTDMLRRRQQLSREEFATGTSVLDEFNTVNTNLAANLEKIQNRLGQHWESSGFRRWMTDITGALLDNRSALEKSNTEYQRAQAEMDRLENSLTPMIDRYDELTKKGKLNGDEHAELQRIIAALSEEWPIAVGEIDAYGNALSINTSILRDNISEHERYLRTVNETAIAEAQAEKERLKRQAAVLKGELSNKYRGEILRTNSSHGVGAEITKRDLSNEELKEVEKELERVNDQIFVIDVNMRRMGVNTGRAMAEHSASVLKDKTAIEDRLAVLNANLKSGKLSAQQYKETEAAITSLNEKLKGLNKTEGEGNLLAKGTTTRKGKTDAEKQIEDAQKAYDQLLKSEEQFAAASLITQKAKNERELAEERARYDKRIDAWEEFKKKKGVSKEQAADADAKILVLEAQADIAVTKLRIKQEEETTRKIEELRTQLANRHETELQKERDRINKFYASLLQDAAGNESEVARITAERDRELVDAGIREAERLKKEKERLALEFVEGQSGTMAFELAQIDAKYDAEILKLREKYSEELQMTAEFHEAMAILEDARNTEKAAKEAEHHAVIRDAAINAAEDVANATFSIVGNNISANLDAHLAAINKERESELANRNLTEAQKKAINEKYDKKEKQEKLKAWKAQQKADMIQAGINMALGITRALASSPPPVNWINAAAVGVASAAQIAVIASKKPPQFGKGGILPGPSHAEGGIDLVDTRRRAIIGNIEGGEPILSRSTYANNREVVDELLYSSQRRNGARISLNPDLMDAEVRSRQQRIDVPAPVVNVSMPSNGDNSEVVGLLRQLVAKENGGGGRVVLSMREFEDEMEKRERVRFEANA